MNNMNNIGVSGSMGTTGDSTNSISTLKNNPIGSLTGVSGIQGTAGPVGYTTQSIIEDVLKKYNMRFTLDKYEFSELTMTPIITIVDNYNNFKDHTFEADTMINLPEDFQSFIDNIITNTRDSKINKVFDNNNNKNKRIDPFNNTQWLYE